MTATMHSHSCPKQPIYVRNVSSRGLGGRVKGVAPAEGEEVVIELSGKSMVGRVRWVRGDRFGIHLRDAIDGADFKALSVWPISDGSPCFQVADCFKPVSKPWRPGVKGVWINLP